MPEFPLTADGMNSSRYNYLWQWRDRFGRWIEMGRGVKFKMRLGNGNTVSVLGDFVGASGSDEGILHVQGDPNGLPDGFYKVKSGNAQEILASLEASYLEKRGIKLDHDVNGQPVAERASKDIPNQADLVQARLDAPDGWTLNKDGSYTSNNGTYRLTQNADGNWEVAQRKNVVDRAVDSRAPGAGDRANAQEQYVKAGSYDNIADGFAEVARLDREGQLGNTQKNELKAFREKQAANEKRLALLDPEGAQGKRLEKQQEDLQNKINDVLFPELAGQRPGATEKPAEATKAEPSAPEVPVTPEQPQVAEIPSTQGLKDSLGNTVPEGWVPAPQDSGFDFQSPDGTYRVRIVKPFREGQNPYYAGKAKRNGQWMDDLGQATSWDDVQAKIDDHRAYADAQEKAKADAQKAEVKLGPEDAKSAAKDAVAPYDNQNGDVAALIDSGAPAADVLAKLDEVSPDWKNNKNDFDFRQAVDLPQPAQRDRWKDMQGRLDAIAKLDGTPAAKQEAVLPEAQPREDFRRYDGSGMKKPAEYRLQSDKPVTDMSVPELHSNLVDAIDNIDYSNEADVTRLNDIYQEVVKRDALGSPEAQAWMADQQKSFVAELEKSAPEAPVAQTEGPLTLDFNLALEPQIQSAMDSNRAIRFFYNGKVREFVPAGIKDGKDGNRNVVFHSEDATRPWQNFTIAKMEPIPATERTSKPVALTEADNADPELSRRMNTQQADLTQQGVPNPEEALRERFDLAPEAGQPVALRGNETVDELKALQEAVFVEERKLFDQWDANKITDAEYNAADRKLRERRKPIDNALARKLAEENAAAPTPEQKQIDGAAVAQDIRDRQQEMADQFKDELQNGNPDIQWYSNQGYQAEVGDIALGGTPHFFKAFRAGLDDESRFEEPDVKEALSSVLAQFIGIKQAPVVAAVGDLQGQKIIISDRVNGVDGYDYLMDRGFNADRGVFSYEDLIKNLDEENVNRIGLLDVLIGNSDRHSGNWKAGDGLPVPIDHGAVLFSDIVERRFVERDEFWKSVYQDGFAAGMNPVFSTEYLQNLRDNLDQHARPFFEEQNKKVWLSNVLRNLDQIIRASEKKNAEANAPAETNAPEVPGIAITEHVNNFLRERKFFNDRGNLLGRIIEHDGQYIARYMPANGQDEQAYISNADDAATWLGDRIAQDAGQNVNPINNKPANNDVVPNAVYTGVDLNPMSSTQEQVIDTLLQEKNVAPARAAEIRDIVDSLNLNHGIAKDIIAELNGLDNKPNEATKPREPKNTPSHLTGPDGESFVPQVRNVVEDGNLIMESVRNNYPDHVVLNNGDIIIQSREHNGKRYDVVVRRTASERFFAYVRETDLSTGSVRAIRMGSETHSAKALDGHINRANKLIMAKKNPTLAVQRAVESGKYHYENGGGQGNNFDPLNNPVQEYIDGINLTADQADIANRAVDALSSALDGMFQFNPDIVQNVRDFAYHRNLPSDFVDNVLDKLRTQKLREAGLVNLPEFADRPTHQDTDGNTLKVGDWVDWTSPEGLVFRAQVVGLKPVENAKRDAGEYNYSDYVFAVSTEYEKYLRDSGINPNARNRHQRSLVSSGLKKVDGPDAPKTPAWDQKAKEAANQENIFTAAKYGVPENPAPNGDLVTLPRQAADLPQVSEANISHNENGIAEVTPANSDVPVAIIDNKGQLDAVVAPLELQNANSVDDYQPGDILVGWNEDGSVRYDQIVSANKDENGALNVEKFVLNPDGNGGQLKTMKLHGAVLPSYYRPAQQNNLENATEEEQVKFLQSNFNILLSGKQMSDTQRAEYQRLIDSMNTQNYEDMRPKLLEIANFKDKGIQESTPQEKLDASAALAREIASAPGTPEVTAGQLDAIANQSEKLGANAPENVPAPEAAPPAEAVSTATPEVPELPVVKALNLREAKVRARAVAERIRDRELPNPEMFGNGMTEERLKKYQDQILGDLIKDGDRRRDKGFNEALDSAIEITKNFGWFDVAAELTAIRARKEKIALREGSADFNANVDALIAAYPEWRNLRKEIQQADVARWYELNSTLRDLKSSIDAMAMYPDVYNKKFRAALVGARRSLDNLAANVAEGNKAANAGLVNKIEDFKRYFDAFGDLPALPTFKYSGDNKHQHLAEVAQQLQGLSLGELRNGVGDWRLTKNISDGINGLHLMENSQTGEQILIKYDNDDNRQVNGVFVGNGINAEEMVAALYRDLGFASPAVAVINPDASTPDLRGLAVMEYANDGFFGLQDIQQARSVSANDRLDEIAPEHQAEILDFLVANGIIGNTDRHRKNYMFGQDPATGLWRIVPIDNGLAMFNGGFHRAEQNADDPLYLRPDKVITGQYGNRNGAAGLASQWVAKVGVDEAKSQIVEFAQRMQKRAEVLKFRDDRANGYISARAQWIIDNIDIYLDAIMKSGRGY